MDLETILAAAFIVAELAVLGGAFALARCVICARRSYYTTRVPH
jgi:hypothetical protein